MKDLSDRVELFLCSEAEGTRKEQAIEHLLPFLARPNPKGMCQEPPVNRRVA